MRNPVAGPKAKRVTVLYHYLHPDDVVSSRLFSDLCFGLAEANYEVSAIAGNRGCRDERVKYAKEELVGGVRFLRVWRPNFPQGRFWGRIANAAWLLTAWGLRATLLNSDVVITGTDPIFSPAVAIVLKGLHKKVRLLHWCFDLYPEAAVAAGLVKARSLIAQTGRNLMRCAYRRHDGIIDIGSCMREIIDSYQHGAGAYTVYPWALKEKDQVQEQNRQLRERVFGKTQLSLLYSGSFGQAHSYADIIDLSKHMPRPECAINFAVRGNRVSELEREVSRREAPIKIEDFCAEDKLEETLGAADILIVSLKPGWEGVVVPSKFFGALALGRPVLFCGSEKSCIAKLIRAHGVGWVLNERSKGEVIAELRRVASTGSGASSYRERAFLTYQQHFSRKVGIAKFEAILRGLN
jgi:colanic acid biosynthesis glycosyl transferase WcaI